VSKAPERRKNALRHIYPLAGKLSFDVFVGTTAGAAKIKAWRMAVGLSAQELADRLGHHRTYVKHLESRKRPWVLMKADAEKLDQLARELKQVIYLRDPRLRIFSRYVLDDGLVNLVRPRRCRGHGKLMLFPSSNQVYCDLKRECKKLWRRKNAGGSTVGVGVKRDRGRVDVRRDRGRRGQVYQKTNSRR
jgi:transcriptional regulator with XRE-family HTH domain